MKPQAILPGLEPRPDEHPWFKLRFLPAIELLGITYSKLEEYAELRGLTVQGAAREALERFFAERASGADSMRKHHAEAYTQRSDYDPGSEP
jgi:hypothetical protein